MEWKMTLLNERTKGREEGRIEGREEGTLLNQIAITTRKVKKGADLSAIAEALEMDKEEVRPIWEAVVAAAPEYDREQILRKITAGM